MHADATERSADALRVGASSVEANAHHARDFCATRRDARRACVGSIDDDSCVRRRCIADRAVFSAGSVVGVCVESRSVIADRCVGRITAERAVRARSEHQHAEDADGDEETSMHSRDFTSSLVFWTSGRRTCGRNRQTRRPIDMLWAGTDERILRRIDRRRVRRRRPHRKVARMIVRVDEVLVLERCFRFDARARNGRRNRIDRNLTARKNLHHITGGRRVPQTVRARDEHRGEIKWNDRQRTPLLFAAAEPRTHADRLRRNPRGSHHAARPCPVSGGDGRFFDDASRFDDDAVIGGSRGTSNREADSLPDPV